MRNLFTFGVVAILVGSSMVAADKKFEVQISEQLKHFSEYRFPDSRYESNWLGAREYIVEQFKQYGLRVHRQSFTTIVRTAEGDKTVEGVNIIGEAKATSNKDSSVVVVGADYDTGTSQTRGPLFNNGAGVTALLETARLFMDNVGSLGPRKLHYTTLFVAFDLNTKEHDIGPGTPGGWHFVNSWLWDHLNQSRANFGGAFVLDSLLNVNQEPNSQETSADFQTMFPETFSRVVEDDNKGNFLGVVTLPDENSLHLKEQFTGNYNKDRMRKSFRLEDMPLPADVAMKDLLSELTTQDTIHFWTFNANGKSEPLPALLITDTEGLRRAPESPCGRPDCPIEDFLTKEREEFLRSTIMALTNTLVTRQTHSLTELELHLQHFEGVRNILAPDSGALAGARSYIKDKFTEFGLELHIQKFETVLQIQNTGYPVSGENIIGVAPGSAGGPVMVLGADYDTAIQRSPLEDNGAGVAALLEIARHYMQETEDGGPMQRLNTIVFVAFDLNVKEYSSNHPGKPGSHHFLHQWLWPFVNQSAQNFGGAIILDSITKYNEDKDSQYMPENFATAFPEAAQDIKLSNNSGNFLAAFVRDDAPNTHLSSAFKRNYLKYRKSKMLRLQTLPVKDGHSYEGVLPMFNHQSHFPFWSFAPVEEQPVSLPALLITDTDVYRNVKEPCSLPCTSDAFFTRRRRAFIVTVIESVTNTLFDLQAQRSVPPTELPVKGNNSGRIDSSLPLIIFTIFAILPFF